MMITEGLGYALSCLRRKTVAELRDRYIGKNLSVSYAEPLVIVRGEGCYLIDEQERRYLDLVNNVAHVGHSNAKVVAETARWSALINTNTRYLHPNLVQYAKRLAETFPAPLEVCFFCCSGSEAADLALRLAYCATNHTDVVVVDHAYHGHTQSIIELSPYKFNGPGGKGCPPHVQIADIPDGYRGIYKYDDPLCGERYAHSVEERVRAIQNSGRSVAAFFCESALGCGGQVFLPPGYLAAAYATVRAAGGVCVADEVQTGFGRVGSSMWAFESQNVVPDIVILGKPIGNGYPLAAVVTTPAIAAAFHNGMEYFNTFAGNAVSMAIGLAVLDTIRDEHLLDNATARGLQFLSGLRALQEKHTLIGDVRGKGLFVGVELVLDRRTLTPAPEQASAVAEHMKTHSRVLVSTDGPHRNVLKIKPPMVISAADVELALVALDRALQECATEL